MRARARQGKHLAQSGSPAGRNLAPSHQLARTFRLTAAACESEATAAKADYEALYTGTLESARFAHGHTQNEALRAYPQRVMDDYSAAQGRLAPLMERHRITARPGTTTQALQRGFEQADATLRNHEGAEFDRHWLDRNIAMNRWLLENIDRSYGPGVERHPELRAELNTLRTTIQGHLQEAERIRGTIR